MAKEKDVKKNPLLDEEEETTEGNDGDVSQDSTEEEVEVEEDSQEETTKDKKPAKPTAPALKRGAGASKVQETIARPLNVQEALVGDAMHTKKVLDKEDKIMFMVPLSPHEKEGAYEEVYINGYRMTIKKGVMVQVPVSVANLLANKYQIEMDAGKDFRIDRSEKVEEAL